jgi:hypothetical protein
VLSGRAQVRSVAREGSPASGGRGAGGWMAFSERFARLFAIAALGCVALAAVAASTPESVFGTYRLHGTARLALGPMFERDTELHADAIVDRGDGGRDVRVRVAAEGYACDLLARLDAMGTLTFADDQHCALTVASSDARGRLEARLRSGRGRIKDGHLQLELSGGIEGALSRRAGGGHVLGKELPATWTPEVPVRGGVEASAEGDLDRSRAAGR